MTWRESPRIMRVGPVNVVLVELDGLGVGLLRVSEEVALHVLAGNDPENGLGGNPFGARQEQPGPTSNEGFSRFPLHSSQGSCLRSAAASVRASSSVNARLRDVREQLGKLVGFGGF